MTFSSKAGRMGVMMGALVIAAPLGAQAWKYPAFQPPAMVVREFNFGIVSAGDYGTTGLGQWRERLTPATDLTFDVGFASPPHNLKTIFFLGGGVGHMLLHSTADVPIDLMFTGGLYLATSSAGSGLRLPFGASIGHRFPMQGTMAITPYVHPRFSFDLCTSQCGGVGNKVNLNFDIGADLEITRELAVRGGLSFGDVSEGNGDVAFGLSLAFRPSGVGGPK